MYSNINFNFIIKDFIENGGFTEAKETVATIKENLSAYEEAAKNFLELCTPDENC